MFTGCNIDCFNLECQERTLPFYMLSRRTRRLNGSLSLINLRVGNDLFLSTQVGIFCFDEEKTKDYHLN